MVPKVVVLGGTAGTGKTSVAGHLQKTFAQKHDPIEFIEGDSLHPEANIEKMAHGIPLTDDDRWGWLKTISMVSTEVSQKNTKHGLCIVTCSSLKKKYRDYIRSLNPHTVFYFVILYGSKELILQRLKQRHGHFMKANMMESQFHDLELPTAEEENCHIVELDRMDYTATDNDVWNFVENTVLTR